MYEKYYNNNEYYSDFTKYQTNARGDEIYAKLHDNTEIYLKYNGLDIMAKKKNLNGVLVPYFATHKDGYPLCPYLRPDMKYLEIDLAYPKNSQNKDLYPRLFDNEIYIGLNNNCKYAKNERQIEYYAIKNRKKYYAWETNSQGELLEYPIQTENGEKEYIIEKNLIQYPTNLTNLKIIYPLDSNNNEMYLEMHGKQIYAFIGQFPVYAKNESGEFFALDNNTPYYAFILNDGSEIYPQLNDKTEIYLEINRRQIYAKYSNSNQYYAKNNNFVTYFAKNNNIPYYAETNDKIEIYPFNKGIESYITINNVEIIAKNKKTMQGYYAKNVKNQYYPKTFIKEIEPIIKYKQELLEPSFNAIITHNATSF